MAVILLSKPGPPMPLARGAATALVLAALLTAGVLMVPVLENYALTGLLLTATVLLRGLLHRDCAPAIP